VNEEEIYEDLMEERSRVDSCDVIALIIAYGDSQPYKQRKPHEL
jgi:hypothetical protein